MNDIDNDIGDLNEDDVELDQPLVESLDENLANLQELSDFLIDRSPEII